MFKFTKAVVVTGYGSDKIMLETDLPSPFPKMYDDALCFAFEAETGTGEDYVKKHFINLLVEVINRPKYVPNFAKYPKQS